MLEELGLISALNALAAEFTRQRRAGGPPPGPRACPPLGSEAELVLYRVAQEGLTNIARHARASRVELTLAGSRGGVLLPSSTTGGAVRSTKAPASAACANAPCSSAPA